MPILMAFAGIGFFSFMVFGKSCQEPREIIENWGSDGPFERSEHLKPPKNTEEIIELWQGPNYQTKQQTRAI